MSKFFCALKGKWCDKPKQHRTTAGCKSTYFCLLFHDLWQRYFKLYTSVVRCGVVILSLSDVWNTDLTDLWSPCKTSCFIWKTLAAVMLIVLQTLLFTGLHLSTFYIQMKTSVSNHQASVFFGEPMQRFLGERWPWVSRCSLVCAAAEVCGCC